MWDTAHPNLRVQREHLSGPGTAYIVIRIDRSWIFPSVQYVRNIVNKVGVRQGESRVPVVLDCSHIYTSDFSSALGAKAMAADFQRRDQPLIFLDIQESVKKTFDGAGHGEVVTADGSEELRTKMEGQSSLALKCSIIVFKLLRQIGNLICPFQSCFRDKKTMPMVTLGSYQIPVLLMPSPLEVRTLFLMYKRRQRTRFLTTKRRWDKLTREATRRTVKATLTKRTNFRSQILAPSAPSLFKKGSRDRSIRIQWCIGIFILSIHCGRILSLRTVALMTRKWEEKRQVLR